MDMTPVAMGKLRSIYDMISLKGKTALITGAAGGIGRASAAALAEAGAAVALVDLPGKKDELEQIAQYLEEAFKTRAAALCADITDETQVKGLFAAVKERFGGLNVVFSNAGIVTPKDNADMTLEDWNRILAVNYTAAFMIAREGAKLMMEGERGGSIIIMSSAAGHAISRRPDGTRYSPTYSSTKAALRQLAKALAMDYAPWKIRVNSISPGYIVSGIHDNFQDSVLEFTRNLIPMKRFGSLDEIVGAVLYFASDLSTFNTANDLLVDGGYCAW